MTHVKGHMQGSIWIKDHEDRRPSGHSQAPQAWHHRLFGLDAGVDFLPPKDRPKPTQALVARLPVGIKHPKADEAGATVQIHYPTKPSDKATWDDPKAVAIFTPGGDAPEVLNGIPLAPWEDPPASPEEWNAVPGQDPEMWEPPFPESTKEIAAGVVIEEPDGRVWVISPTNGYGGYRRTFPKGHVEEGIGLQASAIKEAFEESGLQVEITGYLSDVERTTTVCRYYTAKRVGGSPTDCGWESQSVGLVPRSKLYAALDRPVDWPIAEAIGAGPRPEMPKPAPMTPAPKMGKPVPPKGLFG